MAVGKKRGGLYPVHVYNPSTGQMDYVKGHKDRRRKHADAKKLFSELTAKMHRTGGARIPTVAEFAASWTAAYPRSEQTNRHNNERISLFVKDFGTRSLDGVTRVEARAWAVKNQARVAAVRAMFNDACKDYETLFNPFENLRLARHDREAVERRTPLTEPELQQLAVKALEYHGEIYGPMFAGMILFAAYTGLRAGELFALRWSDITTDTVYVQRQYSTSLGREIPPKHGSTGEVVLLPPARAALEMVPHGMSGLVFVTSYGTQFSQSKLNYTWNPVRVAFGRPRLAFHSLRHFTATWMLNDLGLQAWQVAEQLRHSDGGVLVTQRYGHPNRLVAHDAIRGAWAAANRPRAVGEADHA